MRDSFWSALAQHDIGRDGATSLLGVGLAPQDLKTVFRATPDVRGLDGRKSSLRLLPSWSNLSKNDLHQPTHRAYGPKISRNFAYRGASVYEFPHELKNENLHN